MPPGERQILTAPDAVARAAAPMAADDEQRWMLRQSRDVRRSFADEVFGREDEEERSEVWMLQQAREIRESYVEHVLSKQDPLPRDQIWMLRQDDAVCRSYVREVLRGEDG